MTGDDEESDLAFTESEIRSLAAVAAEVAPQLRAAGVTRFAAGDFEIDIGPSQEAAPDPTGEMKRAPTKPPGRGHPLNRASTFGAHGGKGPPTFKRDDKPDEDSTPEGE